MNHIDSDNVFKLAKAKTLEEFAVIKDTLPFKRKKLNANDTTEVLICMAAQQHDSKLAKKLIRKAEHITVSKNVLHWIIRWASSKALQQYIRDNLNSMIFEIEMWLDHEEWRDNEEQEEKQ